MASAGSNYQWKSVPVTTTDGYILNLFRIMADENSNFSNRGTLGPILLLHGLGSDARSWVDQSRDGSQDSFPV